jgi:hypothetical protein
MSDLEAGIGRGEINSEEELRNEYLRIFGQATPAMSEEELIRIRRLALIWHATIAKSLAEDDHSVPGNPTKPNQRLVPPE